MKSHRRLVTVLAAAASVALLMTGCTGKEASPSTSSNPAGGGSTYTFAVVTHGAAGDAFWDVVKKGSEAAAADLGVTVTYEGAGQPDQQANLINAAVSKKVNGIVVSMANPDALKDSITKAVAAGIPVITINSGQSRSAEFG